MMAISNGGQLDATGQDVIIWNNTMTGDGTLGGNGSVVANTVPTSVPTPHGLTYGLRVGWIGVKWIYP